MIPFSRRSLAGQRGTRDVARATTCRSVGGLEFELIFDPVELIFTRWG